MPQIGHAILAKDDLMIEALHQNPNIGKDDLDVTISYTDMLGSMPGGMSDFDDEEYV